MLSVFTLNKLPLYTGRTLNNGLEVAETLETVLARHLCVEAEGMAKSMSSLLDGANLSLKSLL